MDLKTRIWKLYIKIDRRTESSLVINHEKFTSTLPQGWSSKNIPKHFRTSRTTKRHEKEKEKNLSFSAKTWQYISSFALSWTSEHYLKVNADIGCHPGTCEVAAWGPEVEAQLSLHSKVSPPGVLQVLQLLTMNVRSASQTSNKRKSHVHTRWYKGFFYISNVFRLFTRTLLLKTSK